MIPSALLAGFQFVSSVAGGLEALLSEVPMDSFALAGSHSFTNNMNMVLGQNDSSVSSSLGGGGGYTHIVWMGVCCWVRKSPTLY